MDEFDHEGQELITRQPAAEALYTESAMTIHLRTQSKPIWDPTDYNDRVGCPIIWPLMDCDRTRAREQAGIDLSEYLLDRLPQLKRDLARHGLPTKDVDELIKSKQALADEAKPLQKALCSGDLSAVQKFLKDNTPAQLHTVVGMLQKQADSLHYGIQLQVLDGNKLITSFSNKHTAVLITCDSANVVGVNADGSYDFAKRFKNGDSAKALRVQSDLILAQILCRFERPVVRDDPDGHRRSLELDPSNR